MVADVDEVSAALDLEVSLVDEAELAELSELDERDDELVELAELLLQKQAC